MSDRVAELRGILTPDAKSSFIVNLWDRYNQQRAEKINQWAEVDKYITATDTTTTSNKSLPWTHTTTIPKLTQIRDNLHSNYISSLFPNDKWLSWVAYTEEAARRDKAKYITAYMENKTRMGNFRNTISRLLYDYIDRGNAFAMPSFEARYNEMPNGERTPGFVGPKAIRIDPYDVVFNPDSVSFEESFKIVRSRKTVGELKKLADTEPEHLFWAKAMEGHLHRKMQVTNFSSDDWARASQYAVDGFGSLWEYYQGDIVEILEFYGDWHNDDTGKLATNRMITVIDRCNIVRDVVIPTNSGTAPIRHVGWRFRQGNVWAMGPLDNLVGMQYMLDHYLNMAANALDLKVMPPKVIVGEVEEFIWGPNEQIHIDENGDVRELAQQFGDVITVRDFINELEYKMELYAGAPREAMGIRTPGEKTAFEVQALENASGRIFQEKITQFEIFMEMLLNDMLEITHRNMNMVDVIRVIDDDIGVQQFKTITKADITADGVLRPIGARHFAQKAQELQNLVGVFNTPLGELITPHVSTHALTKFVEDVVNLRGYKMFQKNIAVAEQQELQSLMAQAQEENEMANGIIEEEMMMEHASENQTIQG